MSAALTTCSVVTGLALWDLDSFPTRRSSDLAARRLAGVSLGSVKPKSAAAKVWSVSRWEEHTSELQSQVQFVWRLLLEKKLGDWSKSTPPLAVPPSSWTWKVKVA